MENSLKALKIVLLGDGGVGRTSFCHTYVDRVFKEPTSESFNACGYGEGSAMYKGKPVTLRIHDPTGGDEYDRLRRLSYPETDVFLLLFCVIDEDSLKNVQSFWHQEVVDFGVNTPCILVGTKKELREPKEMEELKKRMIKNNWNPDDVEKVSAIDPKTIEKLVKNELNLVRKYMEVSSKNVDGLEEVMQYAMKLIFDPEEGSGEKGKEKGKCLIM